MFQATVRPSTFRRAQAIPFSSPSGHAPGEAELRLRLVIRSVGALLDEAEALARRDAGPQAWCDLAGQAERDLTDPMAQLALRAQMVDPGIAGGAIAAAHDELVPLFSLGDTLDPADPRDLGDAIDGLEQAYRLLLTALAYL